jgi:hypothetical protein
MVCVYDCCVVFNFLPKFSTGQTVENVALFSTAHPVENFGRKYQKKGGETTHTRRWTVQFSTLFFLPVIRLPLSRANFAPSLFNSKSSYYYYYYFSPQKSVFYVRSNKANS